MKLSAGIIVGFTSCVTAAARTGQAYTFPNVDSSAKSLSSSLARLVLLQRLAPLGQGPSIHEAPDNIETNEVISLLNTFGRSETQLFQDTFSDEDPRKLLVMLEGLSDAQMTKAAKALGNKPSFIIQNAPSSASNERFFEQDLYNGGVANEHKCSLDDILKQTRQECWTEQVTATKINVVENSKSLDDVLRNIKAIAKLAKSKKMESTVVLLPQTGNAADSATWTDESQELRRRQAEQVMASKSTRSSSPTATGKPSKPKGKILPCYDSVESCEEATDKCSGGHGKCEDKYAKKDPEEKRADTQRSVCFACACLSSYENPSKNSNGSLTHWAGPTCAKQDISTPFWLFFGITILLLGVISLSIGLLFNVGEEKLPGVIGAGVSKSK